jgi:integrase
MTAFYTGFRRKELRALCVKHLVLDSDVPFIHLPGAFTKNRQDATIPIPLAFAGQLANWIASRSVDAPLFHIPRHDELLKALKKDLAFANIPYRDDLDRVCDFHSLRKSLGTQLRVAKVDPSVSQLFMRHSDIRLTMEVYNDSRLHDLRKEVVEKLPTFDL